jgi:riboflavin kinase
MGIKKQLIQITERGKGILKDEYVQYQHIFEMPTRIHFTGTVVSGMGEGTYYTAQEGYVKQFKERLGFVPYPGTLNVKIKEIEKNKLRLIKHHHAIPVDSFETKYRTFGEVKCFHAKINKKTSSLVLPTRGHYSTVLEFIAKDNLRKSLGLTDGDTVSIIIDLEKHP